MKTPELERLKSDLITKSGPMADAAAERVVKSSDEWRDYIRKMVDARTRANRFQKQLDHIEKVQWEMNTANANHRAEMRLSR